MPVGLVGQGPALLQMASHFHGTRSGPRPPEEELLTLGCAFAAMMGSRWVCRGPVGGHGFKLALCF